MLSEEIRDHVKQEHARSVSGRRPERLHERFFKGIRPGFEEEDKYLMKAATLQGHRSQSAVCLAVLP
jgi:hypothetical protein